VIAFFYYIKTTLRGTKAVPSSYQRRTKSPLTGILPDIKRIFSTPLYTGTMGKEYGKYEVGILLIRNINHEIKLRNKLLLYICDKIKTDAKQQII